MFSCRSPCDITKWSIAFDLSSVPVISAISFSCTKSPWKEATSHISIQQVSDSSLPTYVISGLCVHDSSSVLSSQAARSRVVLILRRRWQSDVLQRSHWAFDHVRFLHLWSTELLQLLQPAAQHGLDTLVYSSRVHGEHEISRRENNFVWAFWKPSFQQIISEIKSN